MKRGRLLIMKAVTALSVVVSLVAPQAAGAQAGTVGGIVVAAGSQRPLPNAQVVVIGTPGKGAVTDGSGRFTITGLTGATVVLTTRLLGYRPETDTVRVGTTNLHFALTERMVELNAMVVTGTAGGAQVRELGTSVAKVKVSDAVGETAGPSVEGLLTGTAPGVAIIGTSGQVGSGAQIRVRGVGTFSLASTPLVYVDGIRVNNGQTGIVGRFNDIEPEEIESMEVLKGPAAATLYGTEAARGVVNIITKRGTQGAPKYSFTTQNGSQWFQNAAGRMRTNYWLNPQDNSIWNINAVTSEAAAGKPLFHTGDINSYTANVSGGQGIYKYFVSGEWASSNGIEPTNGRQQKAARTNLSIVPSSKIDIETSFGYVLSRTNLAGEGGSSGPMWGVFFSPNRTVAACPILFNPVKRGCGWSRGSLVGPPEQGLATQRWQDVRRTTASASIKYDPFPWMSHRFLIGTDYTLEDINQYLPYQTDSVLVFFLGANRDGNRSETTQQTTYNTYDYTGAVHFDLNSRVNERTAIGVQYYTNSQTALTASGTHFPSPGLSTITATGTKAAPTSSLAGENTLGAYIQQEFALDNRLFVTGAFRVDNNSAFGGEVHFTTYPKVSLSWVASEDPYFKKYIPSFVDQLRLRGAFGASGQQPPVNTALQTITPVAGPNGATVLTNNTIGNQNLKPERTDGIELGFEAGLLNDRASIDLTLFSDVTHDAILAKTVAPSTGYGSSIQYQNAGRIDKHGFEVALRGGIISRPRYSWDMQLSFAATTSKIIKLGGASDTLINVTGGSTVIGTVGDVYHVVGYSPFDQFTYRVVSATYDPVSKRAINPMCDDAHGGVMPCYVAGTTSVQAPLIYYGHSIPTTTTAWINTFRYERFRLYVKVDFQAGHRKTDTNYEQVCQLLSGCLENVYPDRYSPRAVVQAQDGSGYFQDYFIRSASFAKLRDVSLTYDVPADLSKRMGAKALAVTLTGHNIGMLTQYTGIDPEASVAPSSGGLSNNIATDQTTYPQLMSVVISFRVTF